MSTHTSHKDTKKTFEDLFKPREKSAEVKHDSYVLMATFLTEIERVQEEKQISRKDLADKIGTSASYLTQVFRSKKPLNFLTVAKIKRELNIKFKIIAYPTNQFNNAQNSTQVKVEESIVKVEEAIFTADARVMPSHYEMNETSKYEIVYSEPILGTTSQNFSIGLNTKDRTLQVAYKHAI